MQGPHHHRVVIPVVLIIKLSCYHQRKSWFISLTSRYNFFYKTNNILIFKTLLAQPIPQCWRWRRLGF